MKLFEENIENYKIPLYNPNLYKIYLSTEDQEHLEQKKLLEYWFSKIESETKRKELKANLKSKFLNAFFEILTHQILITQGVKLCNLNIDKLTPDFNGRIDNKPVIIEATTLSSKEKRNESYYNRRGQVINTLDNLKIDGLKLEIINLHLKTKQSPNVSKLITQIKNIFKISDEFGTELIYKSNEFDVKLKVYKFDKDKAQHGKVMMVMHFGRGIKDTRLIDKIKKKIIKYKDIKIPIFLFINILSNNSKESSILYKLKPNVGNGYLTKTDIEHLLKLRKESRKISSQIGGIMLANIKPFNMMDSTSIFIDCQNQIERLELFKTNIYSINKFIKVFKISEIINECSLTNKL